MSGDGGFILDTPDQIQAFAWLQTYHKLKLEVDHPDGPSWRYSPMKHAKQIMASNGVNCGARTKKGVLSDFEWFLRKKGVLKS